MKKVSAMKYDLYKAADRYSAARAGTGQRVRASMTKNELSLWLKANYGRGYGTVQLLLINGSVVKVREGCYLFLEEAMNY
jgi:hypothetical protein